MAIAEIFKTNVQEAYQSKELIQMLLGHFPDARINFDLQDCDRILRIEGGDVLPERVIDLLKAKDYMCEVLE